MGSQLPRPERGTTADPHSSAHVYSGQMAGWIKMPLGTDVGLGQLSLLPSAGREMSTSQSAVMLCGWGVKAGMVHSTRG